MDKPILFEDYFDIFTVIYCKNPALMIPIGVNHQGALEQVEITQNPWQHVLVAGHSGSGKSNYIHSVLASLLLNYSADQVNLWLSDGGMCEFNLFSNNAPAHIKRVNTSHDPASYIAFVDALEKEIEERLKCLADGEKTSFYSWCCDSGRYPCPRLIVMIDGFDHFVRCLSEVNHHYVEKTEYIVRRASVCGITFIVSTQEALFLAQRISRSFFELFGVRVATRQSPDSYNVLFNHPTAELTRELKLGEIITNNSSDQKINMLYISPEKERQIVQNLISL